DHAERHCNDQRLQERIAAHGGIGADGADRHHPALRIGPLEGRRLEERQRPPAALGFAAARRRCDPIGQVEEIGRADILKDRVHDGPGLEHLAKADADGERHDGKADDDAHQMRDCPPEAEIGTGRRDHDVVRPRRDRHRHDERQQGQHQVGHAGEPQSVRGELPATRRLLRTTIEDARRSVWKQRSEGRGAMPYYMTQWTYKDRQIEALVDNPHDRYAVIQKLFDSFGGKLHQFFLSFGDYDGVIIAEFPDSVSATACLLTIAKSGGVDKLKTTALIGPKEALKAMKLAGKTKTG